MFHSLLILICGIWHVILSLDSNDSSYINQHKIYTVHRTDKLLIESKGLSGSFSRTAADFSMIATQFSNAIILNFREIKKKGKYTYLVYHFSK